MPAGLLLLRWWEELLRTLSSVVRKQQFGRSGSLSEGRVCASLS